ncbi:two-component system, OmpR family, response regulator, partial [Streptomyces sp. yr375]|uniref:response regulator transcription factor n=1 Tax=Streptomyces sp. yr375 TaxID=1761906 RepID=UPI0008B71D0C
RGRLLVVDDEPAIVDTVTRFLRFVGYEVRTAATGREALTEAREFLPELVLLDIMLPDSDGFEVLNRLRADGLPVAVVFLTARDTRKDLVRGLTAGGDDYITKPFGLDEVAARIGAVLRRTRAHRPSDPTLGVADLILNTLTHEVRRAGALIDLSPTEFRLLRYLMLHQGKVITRARLLEHVWSYDFNGDDTVVATYISYLRRKVDGHGERLIHTHRGVGYSLRTTEC